MKKFLAGLGIAGVLSVGGMAINEVAHADTSGCTLEVDHPYVAGTTSSYLCNARIVGGPTEFQAWQLTFNPVTGTYSFQYGGWHRIGSGTRSTTSIGWGAVISRGVNKR